MATHRILARAPEAVPVPSIARDSEALDGVRRDAAHYPGGHAAGVAHPRSEAEVAAVVRAAGRVLPIGAQSSLTGGATPFGDVVLATDRMDRIVALGSGEVTVEPGLSLAALQEALRRAGAWYPPVPTFDGACAGGVAATNAAGAATFKYGTTRDWVRRLTVVLASGDVLDLARGETRAHPDGYFEVLTPRGARRVPVPSYRLPDVPKCSSGYFAAPGMDLIDLFIGSEGTLGVITAVTFAVVAPAPRAALVWIPVGTEAAAIALAGRLREAARRAWGARSGRAGSAGSGTGGPGPMGAGPAGIGPGDGARGRAGSGRNGTAVAIDVAAIEHLDARSLEIVREDGVARRRNVFVPDGTAVALLVQVEWSPGEEPTAEAAYAEIGAALDAVAPDAAAQATAAASGPPAREAGQPSHTQPDTQPDTQLGGLCRLLADAGVLDDAEIALPSDTRRQADFLAVREAVPEGVNRRVGEAARRLGPAVAKTAADMVVPFDRFAESLDVFRGAFGSRGLDYAVWGHISDGNVHPNVIPRTADDAARGREAILECGRTIVRLGGSPLAEHGVGRNPVKQALLGQLYGDAGVAEMRAVKAALDPEGKLAPGVLFPAISWRG